jgi:hypothetical protein
MWGIATERVGGFSGPNASQITMNNPPKNISSDTGARTEKAQDGKDMIRMESRKKTDRISKD